MRSLPRMLLLATALGTGAACSREAGTMPFSSGATRSGRVRIGDLPSIDVAALMARTRELSSNAFEGRAPGTRGEELTVRYLIDPEPEKGLYYRSDHFNFAREGVPALDPDE